MVTAVAENPRAVVGGNNPPADPWGAIKANLDDLLSEARNWADGQKVETAEQDAAVDELMDSLRKAMKAAEDQITAEKEPLKVQIDAIQERGNEYIAPLKNKKPGKASVALDALKALVAPYRKRIADEKLAEAARVQKEAADKAAAAAEAMRAADASDLGARDAAEALLEEADAAQRDAKKANKAATSGLGLTKYWVAKLDNRKAAILHYMNTQPEQFVQLVQRLADADVHSGVRTIPGFIVTQDARVS